MWSNPRVPFAMSSERPRYAPTSGGSILAPCGGGRTPRGGQSSDELIKRLEATLAALAPELEKQSRVLSIGMHPHVMGAPHRMYYLEKAFDLLARRSDTVFVTSSEIADWFVAADPNGLAELDSAVWARAAS
jgi:hypothetical protein